MFCEAYFVFSIGNISPLLEVTYPTCYKFDSWPSPRAKLAAGYLASPASDRLSVIVSIGI
jgi:hypothetical protein